MLVASVFLNSSENTRNFLEFRLDKVSDMAKGFPTVKNHGAELKIHTCLVPSLMELSEEDSSDWASGAGTYRAEIAIEIDGRTVIISHFINASDKAEAEILAWAGLEVEVY